MSAPRVDPLAAFVAATIVALALYVATLPAPLLIASAGATFTVTTSEGLEFAFTVTGQGGRLLGGFASSAPMSPWIHPASTAGAIPRGPANPPCGVGFDLLLPPGSYLLTIFGGPAVVRVTESIRVVPAETPPGASSYATFSNATACPLPSS